MRRVFQVLNVCIGLSIFSAKAELKGQVVMAGSILETPCAIAMESADQSIDLGTVALSVLKQDGQGVRQPFSVHIVDCRLSSRLGEPWQTFAVTFDGPTDNVGFSLLGHATGISLVLDNDQGERIQPGMPLSAGSLTPGGRTLKYGLRLISNHTAYTPGDFQTTLRFKLDYD